MSAKPLYPSSPAAVDPEKLAISPAFRRQVPKVIGAILLFILVYFCLVIAATGLAIACGWLGVMLMIRLTNFAGILLGLGIVGVGISVLVFLVKFVFAVAKADNSDRIEIKEADEPRLFEFIRQLAGETHTRFPKKIYLSPGVNAAVFYNSSFWSMFLPVRKNLEIGLGLVNSVNISEFKAIIAHEFGHFSQRSMKLGSFTYNVNRVIYNMLYENKDYNAFLRAWGSIHSYLRIFVTLTTRIAGGIQWLLRNMYQVINRNYMGLSREMEFHADTVAASVSGSNNSVSALSRIEVASNCYNTALGDANQQLKLNRVTRNIYPNQLIVMRTIAAEYRIPVSDGLPDFSFQFIQSFSRSRINYSDQWASHPTLKERIANLDRLDMPSPPAAATAWQLFDEAATWQETLTGRLYRSIPLESPADYDPVDFERRYRAGREGHSLPAVFKGFYDGRYIEIKDWDLDALALDPDPGIATSDLFNEEHGRLQSTIDSNRKDLEILKAIKEKKIPVGSFDFDGIKHASRDCDTLIRQLQDEVNDRTHLQQDLDKTAYRYFIHLPGSDKDRLKAAYRRFRAIHLRHEEYVSVVNRVMDRIRPLYSGKVSLSQINSIIKLLKSNEEARLKKTYRELLSEDLLGSQAEVSAFLEKDYAYFHDGQFLSHELQDLTGLAMHVAGQLNGRRFERYKSLLELQASLVGATG